MGGIRLLRQKKGASLLAAIILFAVIMVAGVTAVTASGIAVQGANLEVREQQAYYIAKSAVDAMVAAIQSGRAKDTVAPLVASGGAGGLDTSGSALGGTYDLRVSRESGKQALRISATGHYSKVSYTLAATLPFTEGGTNVRIPLDNAIFAQEFPDGLGQITGSVVISNSDGQPVKFESGYNVQGYYTRDDAGNQVYRKGVIYSTNPVWIGNGARAEEVVSLEDVYVYSTSNVQDIYSLKNVYLSYGASVNSIASMQNVIINTSFKPDGSTGEGSRSNLTRALSMIDLSGKWWNGSTLKSASYINPHAEQQRQGLAWSVLTSAEEAALQGDVSSRTGFSSFDDLPVIALPAGYETWRQVTYDGGTPNPASVRENIQWAFSKQGWAGQTFTFDTTSATGSGGDIHVVVTQSIRASGVTLRVLGPHNVYFYLKDGVDVILSSTNSLPRGSDASGKEKVSMAFIATGTSSVEFLDSGEYNAVVYGPRASFRANGGTTVRGGLIARRVSIQNNRPVYYDPSVNWLDILNGAGGSGSGEISFGDPYYVKN